MKWHNVIQLCELLFSLPFSTAKVERLFLSLKVVKNEKRTNLNCFTLNDLLEVKTEGPSVSNFSADAAMELWWKFQQDEESRNLKRSIDGISKLPPMEQATLKRNHLKFKMWTQALTNFVHYHMS